MRAKAAPAWKVKFCEQCCRAYDVMHKGCRTAELCPECRRANKTTQQVRRREQERAAA